MPERNLNPPKLSDWSTTSSDRLPTSRTIEQRGIYPTNNQANDLHSSHQPVKCCMWMPPFLQGLVLGILINGIALAVILTLWIKSQEQTTIHRTLLTFEVPPGTILLYSGNLTSLPNKTHRWLFCNGSAVSRTTYKDLFDVIGITHGAGNGNTTFNLPDFQARFPMGSNGGSLTAGGASSHTLTVAEIPAHSHSSGTLETLTAGAHSHSINDPGHNHGGSTGSSSYSSGTFAMDANTGGAGDDNGVHSHSISTDYTSISILSAGDHTHTVQGSTDSVGGNQPFDMIPPYQSVHYIIRA